MIPYNHFSFKVVVNTCHGVRTNSVSLFQNECCSTMGCFQGWNSLSTSGQATLQDVTLGPALPSLHNFRSFSIDPMGGLAFDCDVHYTSQPPAGGSGEAGFAGVAEVPS